MGVSPRCFEYSQTFVVLNFDDKVVYVLLPMPNNIRFFEKELAFRWNFMRAQDFLFDLHDYVPMVIMT